MKSIEDRIEEFKSRVSSNPEFYQKLYEETTVRLLAFKYAYYILAETIVKDDFYDGLEQSWYVMGRGLGLLNEDETSPCVGFDENHPMAEQGIALAKHFLKIK
jgi:NAD-dependent DNA ligase